MASGPLVLGVGETHLLSLPREIRYEIYRILFTGSVVTVDSGGNMYAPSLLLHHHHHHRRLGGSCNRHQRGWHPIVILQTNRLLRREARPVVFDTAIIHLDRPTAWSVRNLTADGSLRRVRRLVVDVECLARIGGGGEVVMEEEEDDGTTAANLRQLVLTGVRGKICEYGIIGSTVSYDPVRVARACLRRERWNYGNPVTTWMLDRCERPLGQGRAFAMLLIMAVDTDSGRYAQVSGFLFSFGVGAHIEGENFLFPPVGPFFHAGGRCMVDESGKNFIERYLRCRSSGVEKSDFGRIPGCRTFRNVTQDIGGLLFFGFAARDT